MQALTERTYRSAMPSTDPTHDLCRKRLGEHPNHRLPGVHARSPSYLALACRTYHLFYPRFDCYVRETGEPIRERQFATTAGASATRLATPSFPRTQQPLHSPDQPNSKLHWRQEVSLSGLDSIEVTSGWLLNTWRGVQNDIRADSAILKGCRAKAEDCPPAAKTFLAIITEGRAHTGRTRIGIINRAINWQSGPRAIPLIGWAHSPRSQRVVVIARSTPLRNTLR